MTTDRSDPVERARYTLRAFKSPSFDRDLVQALVDEIDHLRHDIGRYVAIASVEVATDVPVWLADLMARWPLGTVVEIEHDGFRGPVIGYYRRDDGRLGVDLQFEGRKIVHVYGERWLKTAEVRDAD